jgi:hypothetical protein
MRTCPDCHKHPKKYNDPTLSPGGFLDQIIICSCGWCSVDSIALTEDEAEVARLANQPYQLRMEI